MYLRRSRALERKEAINYNDHFGKGHTAVAPTAAAAAATAAAAAAASAVAATTAATGPP